MKIFAVSRQTSRGGAKTREKDSLKSGTEDLADFKA